MQNFTQINPINYNLCVSDNNTEIIRLNPNPRESQICMVASDCIVLHFILQLTIFYIFRIHTIGHNFTCLRRYFFPGMDHKNLYSNYLALNFLQRLLYSSQLFLSVHSSYLLYANRQDYHLKHISLKLMPVISVLDRCFSVLYDIEPNFSYLSEVRYVNLLPKGEHLIQLFMLLLTKISDPIFFQ